jgi:uncharacterized phage protein (TIGR01671 family)
MSREIKFRFWDSIRKEWMVDGRSEANIYDFAFKVGMNWTFITKKEALERVIVMQFTGLEDKNSKEIYEGDIIPVWENGEEYNYKVIYDGDCFMLSMLDSEQGSYPLSVKNRISAVIGNIYENPELLTATK